jgi:oxygen-independent coproporphyrinogen-3 oxidase
MPWTAETPRNLYLHVPFCAHKCEYCAFYSHAPNAALVNRYVAALIRELRIVAVDLRPGTIFFGGGTPSLLNLNQWEQILQHLDNLDLLRAHEWTVECNPATISLDKASSCLRVNRFPWESISGPIVGATRPVHTREMVFKSFDTLRRAGFENINLDLMFAIPGQTRQVWRGVEELWLWARTFVLL